jgi:hypothetical protein
MGFDFWQIKRSMISPLTLVAKCSIFILQESMCIGHAVSCVAESGKAAATIERLQNDK